MVIEITKLAELKQELAKNKKTIIDCYTDWCGPCQMLKPVLEKIASVNQDCLFLKINIEKLFQISEMFSIEAVPSLLFMQGEKIVHKMVGFQSFEKIQEAINLLKKI